MTSEQFCYWLQGFFELKKTIDHREGATPETMQMIEDHLQIVFMKVTPSFPTKVGDSVGPLFADPARQLTPLEILQRSAAFKTTITC